MFRKLHEFGRTAALLLLVWTGAWTAPARADGPAPADDAPPDRTLSPYFQVEGAEDGVDTLPLKSTKVDVRVLGVIADVTVTQRYRNTGRKPIEARYVFPGSTRAAVHGLSMRLGDRLLTARIREREQARAEYEAGRKAGKTAALLAQHRENVFQMSVANILPGDTVDVELHYTELLVPTDGRYQFVFPTVVGPRYNGAAGTPSHRDESWLRMPFLRAGEPVPWTFDLQVELATPIAVQEVTSPSHTLSLVPGRDGATLVRLADTGRAANDRDFVLDYRLAGDAIQSGVLLSKGRDENFFLAMVEPPAAVTPSTIVPRDYVFVVDVSGSMHGFPLATARALITDLLGSLRPSDTFNLLLFAGDDAVFAERSVPATRANLDAALTMLANMPGGGGTELLPAMRHALALPLERDRARSIVVVTDGYVSIEREAFDLIRRNLSNANLFAFGIGAAVNRSLIEGMARAGHGEPFVVLDPADAPDAAVRFRKMIESPVLTHVTASFEGFDAYDVAPAAVPDAFASRPIVVYGKWRGDARGEIVIRGRTAAGAYESRLPIAPSVATPRNHALRYLWARNRITELADEESLEGGSERRDAILALGLKYGLMTSYTSFVAVDEIVRRSATDVLEQVDQASPLPSGVSELAVGGDVGGTVVPATPEPETAALLGVLGVIGAAWLRRQRRRAGVRS